MYATPEQIQAAGKATLEDFFALASAQLSALQKLASLNASALRSALDDSIANSRAYLPSLDRNIAYSKSLQEMLAEMGVELSKAAERRLAEWNSVVTLVERSSNGQPKTKKAAG